MHPPSRSNVVSLYVLYQFALHQIEAGQLPANVIRAMIAAGESPARVTRVMRCVQRALDRQATLQAAHTAALRRDVATALLAGKTDRAVERDLAARGVSPIAARAVVRAARRSLASRMTAGRQGRPPVGRPVRYAPGPGLQPLFVVMLLCLLIIGARAHLLGAPASLDHVRFGQDERAPVEGTVYYANAIVIADQLNVRAGPGADYPLLTQLRANEPLYVIGRSDDVARFKALLRDSRIGWVRNDPSVIRLLVAPESIPLATVD